MKILFALFIVASALPAFAADQTLHDRSGTCSITVPADWSLTPALGSATSPDKKVSLIVSSPSHGLNSLADVKQIAPTIYKEDKVTRNNANDFEMEGKSQGGKPNIYRAIPAAGKVCIAEIVYENNNADAARAILETMKPAK